MRRSGLTSLSLIALFLASTHPASAGLLGVFQGTIVKSSALNAAPNSRSKTRTPERWLYVQSRNGYIRRVNVAKALVEYDEDVPAKQRHKNPAESLRLAAEVRITAEQDHTSDGSGDWQAKEVLILAAPQNRNQGNNHNEDKTRPEPTKPRSGTTPMLITTE